MFSCRLLALIAAFVLSSTLAVTQQRSVAITFDDLPFAGRHVQAANAAEALAVNKAILDTLAQHHASATGFVIQKSVQRLGNAGTTILRTWVKRGYDLGNHGYSHADFNKLTVAAMEEEIIDGEGDAKTLMTAAGRRYRYFRFPMNHTGDTNEKHDQIAAFLAGRGYKVAACTIDNSDYIFNDAYVTMLAKHDMLAAGRLRREYLSYTAAEIDYYAGLNRQALGYDPPQIMLLHDSPLNAAVLDDLLRLFERENYRFLALDDALADPAYTTPDTFVSKYGPMWGYRWAAERHVAVNGKLEPEPPAWIANYPR